MPAIHCQGVLRQVVRADGEKVRFTGELRGHYVGHYLSSCALLHSSTGDQAILVKANELVDMLAESQAKDGYLGAYPAAFYEKLRKHEKVWAPFYTYHKIVAGFLDMYEHTGNQQALGTKLGQVGVPRGFEERVVQRLADDPIGR